MKMLKIISINDISNFFRRSFVRLRSTLIKDKYPEITLVVEGCVAKAEEKYKIILEGKIVSFGKFKKRFEDFPIRPVYRYAPV